MVVIPLYGSKQMKGVLPLSPRKQGGNFEFKKLYQSYVSYFLSIFFRIGSSKITETFFSAFIYTCHF
ncbi:MAG TPA: hypothetical protein DDE71_06780 [Tenacibaculum sp.]|nr:hypothetical protein [Tenacibaculum sp.]